MTLNRRDLLKCAAAAGWIPLLSPNVMVWAQEAAAQAAPAWDRFLILVELAGGNDGLNTFVPTRNDDYYRLRPKIALKRDATLELSGELGAHPSLKPLMDCWNDLQLAIALGVGYEQPNRSHFRSIEIWETASESDEYLQSGWIARAFEDSPPPKTFAADGIIVGKGDQGPLLGPNMRNVVMNDPDRLTRVAGRMKEIPGNSDNKALGHLLGVRRDLQRAAQIIDDKRKKVKNLGAEFSGGQFGRTMKTAAELVVSGVPVSVIKVRLGGFDTHSNQLGAHSRLLGELARGLGSFREAMQSAGLWDRVLVMTYSEFGRRVAENGSNGTDHGTAAPHMLLGGKVKGGIYGAQPSLSDLLKGGDMKYTLDYRRLYATVAKKWWKLNGDPVDAKPLDII